MSKLVPCAGLFNDYLDADGPDGADGPEECDQPPSASAKRHRQSLQQSASSLLSAGPSTASLQGPSPPGPARPAAGRARVTVLRESRPLA